VTVVALFLGIWLIAVGVIRFVAAFETPEHRFWKLILAAIEVLAGIVIVSDPNIGFATLALFIGLAFIFNGCAMVLLGWAAHATKDEVALSDYSAPAAT
jgi:uncharacterized membrane protein HdeD (DUF308 family)